MIKFSKKLILLSLCAFLLLPAIARAEYTCCTCQANTEICHNGGRYESSRQFRGQCFFAKHDITYPEDMTHEQMLGIYQREVADKVFASGKLCGDCVSWTRQLFECAGITFSQPINTMKTSTSGPYFLASGDTCTEAANNVSGGLQFGDLFYADGIGHMFSYTGGAGLSTEIAEMGGRGCGRTTVAGISGQMATVCPTATKEQYFSWIDPRTTACRVYRVVGR